MAMVLGAELTRLEAAGETNGLAVEQAIQAFSTAVCEHGDGSAEAREAEAVADRLFDAGEAITARRLTIEAILRGETSPRQIDASA